MKYTFLTIPLFIIVVLLISFGANYLDWASVNFFAPKYEDTRRKVFEHSNAYNAGMLRDLENIEMEYSKATPEAKLSLRAVALHRFSVYNEDELTPHLRNFYNQLRSNP